MSVLVPTRRVAGPSRRGARGSAEAGGFEAFVPETSTHLDVDQPPEPALGDFPDLWSSGLDVGQIDGEQLELEAMTEYLASSFSGDLPTLDDLQFATAADCVPLAAVPVLQHATSIKAEYEDPHAASTQADYEDTDRMHSGAQASGWTKEEGPSGLGEADDTDGNDGGAMSSKRRRRIRNLKQQELNRLAQQRYRLRKKQKHSDLQTALDSLTEKLAALDAMSKQAEQLRAVQASLQRQLAETQAALLVSEATVLRQTQQLAAQKERLASQDRQLQEQQAATSAAALLRGAGNVNPVALCEQVLTMVKAALQEVSAQPGGLVQAQVQDAVVQHLSRSLSRCCLEYGQKAGVPLRNDSQPVPVPCC